jgi:hypothetical protein
MPTGRQNLRVAALAALAGLPSIGTHVFAPRLHRALQEAELPALMVQVDEEDSRIAAPPWRSLIAREALLVIVAVVKQAGDYDAALEQIWAEVEPALFATHDLGGVIKAWGAPRLSPKEVDPNGDQPCIKQALVVPCHYLRRLGVPDQPL